MSWNAGFGAFIEHRDQLRRTFRLVVYRDRGNGMIDVYCDDGSVTTISEAERGPDNAGWQIPDGAIGAVAEAFHPHAGHKFEVARLEEALKLERERVDRILDRRPS